MSPDVSANTLNEPQHLHSQLANDPGNSGLTSKYFWTLHHQMKLLLDEGSYDRAADCVVEMGLHQLPLDKAANATGWAVHKLLKAYRDDRRTVHLGDAAIAGLVKAYVAALPYTTAPDKLHSAILWVTTQMQGEDRTPWYVPLVRAVGFERMQPSDFDGKEVNGYPLPSLAERVAVASAKQIEAAPAREESDWLMPLIDRLLERKPQNVWLKYHKAKLLLSMNCLAEARAYVQPVVTGKRTEFWAWAVLGETYAEESPEKALSCLCKAVTLKDDEVFLLGIREQLAQVLARMERFREAKAEIERLAAVRRNKNYRIPARIGALMDAPWYAECQAADNAPLYDREARAADDMLFQDAQTHIGVVTNIDLKSRSCFITFRLDCSARFRYHRTPWGRELPRPGTFVTIRVRQAESEGAKRFEAVSMQHATGAPDPSFARAFAGDIKIIAKLNRDPIGFVGDVFVPSVLLKQTLLTDGAVAAGVAVREMNRTKGEYGWRAVAVGKGETDSRASVRGETGQDARMPEAEARDQRPGEQQGGGVVHETRSGDRC